MLTVNRLSYMVTLFSYTTAIEQQKTSCKAALMCTVPCTTKPVQHTLDIFELSGLTDPNKRDIAKRSYNAGYQLGKSTQGFSVWLRARSHERGGVSDI